MGEESHEVSIYSYIAPWALPKEQIPFHFYWPKEIEFQKIEIILPKNFTIIEILNVEDFEKTGEKILINKLKNVKELNSPNYFGGVIQSKILLNIMEFKHERYWSIGDIQQSN